MTTAITKKKIGEAQVKHVDDNEKKTYFFEWFLQHCFILILFLYVFLLYNNEVTHSLTHSTFNILLLLLFTLSFGCWLCSFILIEWVDNPKRKKNCTVLLPLTRWQWREKTDRNVKKEADTRTQTANKQQIFLLVLIH